MLGPAAMLAAAAGGAAGGGGAPTETLDPPTNVFVYPYQGPEFLETGVQWSNGDSSANTSVGFSTNPAVEPTFTWTAVAPTVTSVETQDCNSGRYWWARHTKVGEVSAWVLGGTAIGVACF